MIPLRDINPTERFPVITIALIALNIAVFVFELTLRQPAGEVFVNSFALVPAKLFARVPLERGAVPAVATVFTSMFLHGGFLHLAGNMLYLWIFGNNIEDATGRLRFVAFYLVCGAAAAYAHAYANRFSLVPMIGASGAISGVLGAYLVLYPRARVLTLIFFGFFIRTVQVPAMAILIFWFALQFVNALLESGMGGGVAWYAHVAGFVAGVLLIAMFKRKNVPFWGGRDSGYS
ncbi:MAG TPA: rhomboid family intramembrane serine protease [Nitrospirota bacterium]|nr:rhomboid family intramembrane serine protease [Nitrospirota bacterium]